MTLRVVKNGKFAIDKKQTSVIFGNIGLLRDLLMFYYCFCRETRDGIRHEAGLG